MNHLKTHWQVAGVAHNELFSIDVTEQAYFEIIDRLLNLNRDLDALAFKEHSYWRGVKEVINVKLETESKLADFSRMEAEV